MPSFDKIRKSGTVASKKGNGFYDVQTVDIVDDKETKSIVLCRLCGKMRTRNISVLVGDSVDVDVSMVDPTKGIIVYRSKKPKG